MPILTGVGSRETPDKIQRLMQDVGFQLGRLGWTLRSGGAKGADTAFEEGFKIWGLCEIYVPWQGFNNRPKNVGDYSTISKAALAMAENIHPAWDKCNDAAKKLHARNCYQVLGSYLKDPSDALVCWTDGGHELGGTRTAIVLAREYDVPIYNLGLPKFEKFNADKLVKLILEEYDAR